MPPKVWAWITSMLWIGTAMPLSWLLSQQFHDPDAVFLVALILGCASGWWTILIYDLTLDWRERRDYRASKFSRRVTLSDEPPFNVEWWREVWTKHLRETRSGSTLHIPPATDPPEDSE
jgi:hypothetical protein